ncbi:MAG: GNAT family N-acetyltransferase [Egibacteraceae bacterium]
MAQPILHGDGTTLRPVPEYDVELLAARLAAILAEPEVRSWWPGYDLQRVRSELLDCDDAVVFTIEVDGEVVGAIQYYEEPDADYRHAAIDVFLHPAAHGRGLGSDAVRTLARHLFGDRHHHRLTIDPAVANTKAIACYKRVGFREVGVMRQYERGQRGEWHDSLLMDMLRHELR